jgi:hypothetical protein
MAKKSLEPKAPTIRDRVLRLERVKAGDLVPNAKNWRRHPEGQADALRGVLKDIGYADALLAREVKGKGGKKGLMLIDGHLRAATTPDSIVPVLVLDVTEAEADKLLATLDPLAAMAEADHVALKDLLASVSTEDPGLRALLDSLMGVADLGASVDGFESKAGAAGDASSDTDGWPVIALKVPPPTKARFDAALVLEEGEPWERFEKLLTKAGAA